MHFYFYSTFFFKILLRCTHAHRHTHTYTHMSYMPCPVLMGARGNKHSFPHPSPWAILLFSHWKKNDTKLSLHPAFHYTVLTPVASSLCNVKCYLIKSETWIGNSISKLV